MQVQTKVLGKAPIHEWAAWMVGRGAREQIVVAKASTVVKEHVTGNTAGKGRAGHLARMHRSLLNEVPGRRPGRPRGRPPPWAR